MSLFAAPTPEEMGQAAPQTQFADTGMGQAVQTVANALPTIGGIAGGIAGGVGGGAVSFPLGGTGAIPGAIAGAALGEAGGQGYKDFIETTILGKKPKTMEETMQGLGGAAAEGAIAQTLGEGVGAALGAAVKYVPKAVYEPVAKWAGGMVDAAKNKITEPVMKILAERATPMNTKEAGDAVKFTLRESIKQKYAPFIDAYKAVDDISKAMPLGDEARRSFTQKMKASALESMTRDNYRIVAKIADDIDASANGLQIDDLVMNLRGKASSSYAIQDTTRGKFFSEVADQVEGFLEKQTESLAQRVSVGRATPQEMAAFEQMMAAQQNPTVPLRPENLQKYTKSVANDFLKGKAKIDSDYAGFKTFLEDVGEQSKIKMRKYNTKALLDKIDEVPSEQLIEKMFQEKNSSALLKMQKQSPEVFDVVRKSKMSEVMRASSPDGKLDLKEVWKAYSKMPESTRRLLLSDAELSQMQKIAFSPKLKRVEALQKSGDSMIANWIKNLYTAAEVGVESVPSAPSPLRSAVKYGVGTTADKLIGPLRPQEQLPRTVNGLGE